MTHEIQGHLDQIKRYSAENYALTELDVNCPNMDRHTKSVLDKKRKANTLSIEAIRNRIKEIVS